MIRAISHGHVVQVGIMGKKVAREDPGGDGKTNADIGAIHEGALMEMGSVSQRIPVRSFLRMPIRVKYDQIIKQASKGMADLLAEPFGYLKVLKNLGIACEVAIQEAFATRGFGHWKPNAPSTVKRKHSDAPLIDTGQLRRSITSRVIEKS